MFQFTGLLSYTYVFNIRYLRITVGEFPHSDISGSKLTYSSPKHFVVCHVLLQLLVPRHPPYALTNLITICFLIWLRYFNVIYRDIFQYFYWGSKIYHYHIIQFSKNYFSWEINLSKLSKNSHQFTKLFLIFLHRKEVIHPHVPVGIPCYDFTPVTCPTFAGPLLKG